MAATIDVDSQVVISRESNGLGTGSFQQELKNQQLNEALASGTVERILMKVPTQFKTDQDIVIHKDLINFLTKPELIDFLKKYTFDFGNYATRLPLLRHKRNASYRTASKKPSTSDCSLGEALIDEFDASLWLRGNKGNTVMRVNAGTIDGHAWGDWASKDWVRTYVRDALRAAFDYNSSKNELIVTEP